VKLRGTCCAGSLTDAGGKCSYVFDAHVRLTFQERGLRRTEENLYALPGN
jgi:hypothetical protein